MEKLYLAGGCFWCIGDYFLMQDGVEEVNCGYSGGDQKDVTYYEVKAVIDIDAPIYQRFSKDDQKLLEEIADVLKELF